MKQVIARTLDGGNIQVTRTHFSAENGDRGVVHLNGERVDYCLVANTHFGYVIQAEYPYRLDEKDELVTRRLDGNVTFNPTPVFR